MKLKTALLLLGIVVLALALRAVQIGKVPISPDWDEVALGYNAYSILLTGRDEYGKFLPVVLQSFDDYKPALYAYLVVPFIKYMGLNIIAVRLPSVLFGTATVLATFFLVKELFARDLLFYGKKISADVLALLSALFLAISPWHIQFSRVAFESNVGVACNVFAFLFFLKGLQKFWYLPLSFAVGALNLYVYQSEKVFTPLLFVALIVIYRKRIFAIPKKWLVTSVASTIIISIPLFQFMLSNPNALLRAKGVSIFSDQTELLRRSTEKLGYYQRRADKIGTVLNNRRAEYAKKIFSGYLSHFDPNWLFIRGDLERHHAPFMGLLYFFDLPFILIGIYSLFFGRHEEGISPATKCAIFSFFLLAPLPAAITTGVPHAVRTLNFLPMYQMFVAIGVVTFVIFISKIKYQIAKVQIKYILFVLSILFSTFNFLYFLDQYFVQMNQYYSKSWQYGYEETVSYVASLRSKYRQIVVSNVPPLDQSYMFFLFYLRYDPAIYQKEGGTRSGGFREDKQFSNFVFRPIDWVKDDHATSTLFVGIPHDLPVNIDKQLFYLDGEEAIRVSAKP